MRWQSSKWDEDGQFYLVCGCARRRGCGRFSPEATIMLLGIEIGGTKLQLGIGDGTGRDLAALVRLDVNARQGAAGILEQIENAAAVLIQKYDVERIGIGFGGPVDSAAGTTTKSHQVTGWERFPLSRSCLESLKRPATLGNDCDSAALAEARFGAGRHASSVFYDTLGTGTHCSLVIDGQMHGRRIPP